MFERRADRCDLVLVEQKMGVQGRAARATVANGAGLIPNYILGAKHLDQHHHVDSIDRRVHAAAIDRSDIISAAAVQRQLEPRLVPVVGYIGQASAAAAESREEVEAPAA